MEGCNTKLSKSSHEGGSLYYPPVHPQLEDGSISVSITSSSSSASNASPKSHRSGAAPLSDDAACFFSDLSNYLPLGCLCLEHVDELPAEQNSINGWRAITQLPSQHSIGYSLSPHVSKLVNAGWIRLFSNRGSIYGRYLVIRIYILPFDVGLRYVDRQSKRLYVALENLLAEVDVGTQVWQGYRASDVACKFDMYASSEEGSLFWLFNQTPSPSPSKGLVREKYTHEAMVDLLKSNVPGLKTQLYRYQRRSAALMLQRELAPSLELDPRLELRLAPDGSEYYYGARDLTFLKHPRHYEACQGGILAETMGLATRDHTPRVPAPYSLPLVRPSTASLADMVASNINRKSIPWRTELRRAVEHRVNTCLVKLENVPPIYQIPLEPVRWNRKTVEPPPKRMVLAATTVIVVPRNLCKQWQAEVQKHVDAGLLHILVMDNSKQALPQADEIRKYDIVLFTRSRFEAEVRDGSDEQGRRLGSTQLLCRCPYIGASRTRDCHCLRTDQLYDSPLKHVHFKRLIIDEGHFFSNASNTAATVANKLITADARWVVSGTPAKDLLGVEVDMSSSENSWQTTNTKDSREAVLQQRRHFSKKDDTDGAIRSLGALATNFLQVRPWAAPTSTEKGLQWDEYIYRHEDARKRTYSGFSTCLRRVLNAMVIKTQPEDVELDVKLPELNHEVIRLQPSFYDKLTANLFTLVLTANAVTSERTDQDYLFHKNSQKARSQLIGNLRQSAFCWTGFSTADVKASLKSSRAYLAKENTNCTEADRALLTETFKSAHSVLASKGWKSMSRSHELGVFVRDWPGESAEHWSFDVTQQPLLTGISQLLEAQKYVNERVGQADPGEGLGGAGIRALAAAQQSIVKTEPDGVKKVPKPVLMKNGIPTSSIDGEPTLRRRSSSSAKVSPKRVARTLKVVKPKDRRRSAPAMTEYTRLAVITAAETNDQPARSSPPSDLVPDAETADINATLPHDSPFLRSSIVGTTSAKLSYLASQILRYYEDEKILIFYDGENAAYYIAQMLELLHIKHQIYAKTLAANLKSEYVVRFDQEVEDRVLLMDVRNAAFGLNLPSASRIFFVNPTCRPNVEAQAIKRAHRIGQTRPVFVETLVLKGTIEEKMLERSQRMTGSEHREAGHLEDDVGIREIIQSARIIPLIKEERSGRSQMAPLEERQQLWCREGYASLLKGQTAAPNRGATAKKRKHEDIKTEDNDEEASRVNPLVRRTLAFVKAGPLQASNDDDQDVHIEGLGPGKHRWTETSAPSVTADVYGSTLIPLTSELPEALSSPQQIYKYSRESTHRDTVSDHTDTADVQMERDEDDDLMRSILELL
ncbi:hypothetical protein LTR09_002850 [Extremus antarcticus]|uniref:Helicase C-terminal domain-containing protein n=1 Tax=Extremus antarcticus TaxID=702011 RepID=A0AAJ0LUY0_9PEZI|nr:hypothetical protein LTR09_002850 [Extremus antarcticus]